MIVLKEVEASDKDKLWNIFQKYFYEMSAYYDIDMDERGNYRYKYFENYFSERERTTLFVYDDEDLIGFAMINNYSCLGDRIDHGMAEFTIFPRYRKRSMGKETVEKIFERYRGIWEIKYSNENKAAGEFWRKATEKYKPIISSYGGNESVLSFTADR